MGGERHQFKEWLDRAGVKYEERRNETNGVWEIMVHSRTAKTVFMFDGNSHRFVGMGATRLGEDRSG